MAARIAGSGGDPSWKSVLRPGLFEGRVYIVTGGGSGIGFAITRELLVLGATVVICGRHWDRLRKAAYLLACEALGGGDRLHIQRCDVRADRHARDLVAHTVGRYGRLDGLVNNAGGQFTSMLEDLSAKGLEVVLKLNVIGTFNMSRAAYDVWKERDSGGVIVNIAMDTHAFPMLSHSVASREAVLSLTKSMAVEWVKQGVRVCAVSPGFIYSDSAFAHYGGLADTFMSTMLPAIPAKRLGSVEEVSGAVTFLLSPAASYITGINLPIDGGSKFVLKPLFDIPDITHLPVYGTLPTQAKM